MAGLAAAQVRGNSREPAFRARPVELSFGAAVQHVERYVASGIPRVRSEQIIQPGLRMVFPVSCQAGAQDAAGFEQRLVDRVPVGSQRGGQRGGGHAVERDGGEHCALLAAEALIDGPAQRAEKRVPFCALVRLEAGGKPVPVFLFERQCPGLPEAAASRRRQARHHEL